MRLIDADALKQRIREKFDGLIERIEINSVINAQPTADVPQWIPCSERLPNEGELVLATTDWDEITIADNIGNNMWFIHEGNTNATTEDITAWMPLPEPYTHTWEGKIKMSDYISRQAAIEAIIKLKHKPEFNSANSIRDCYVLTEAQEAIKHLPSAAEAEKER